MGPQFKPVGKILKASDLSEAEKRELKEKYGWDGESEIPSNLPDLLEENPDFDLQAQAAAAAQKLPEGFQLPNQDLDVSTVKTKEIDKIPEDLMQKYSQKVGSDTAEASKPKTNSAFEQARQQGIEQIREDRRNSGMHPDMASAVQELDQQLSQDTSQMEQSQPSEQPQQPEPSTEPTAEKEPADPLSNYVDVIQRRLDRLKKDLTKEDKLAYAEAIFNGQLFTKTFPVLGGKINITFREPSPYEEEEVQAQLSIDRLNKRAPEDPAMMENHVRRYNIAAAIAKVVLPDGTHRVDVPLSSCLCEYLDKAFPKASWQNLADVNEDDRPIRAWTQFLWRKLLFGSLHSLVQVKYDEFQNTLVGLRVAARDTDFFDNPA